MADSPSIALVATLTRLDHSNPEVDSGSGTLLLNAGLSSAGTAGDCLLL